MRKQFLRIKNPIFWSLVALSLCLGLAFQNCSNARLSLLGGVDSPSESVTLANGKQIEGPLEKPQRQRVFIVVDHSYSNLYGRCAQDLDGVNTALLAANITDATCPKRAPGSDPTGNRFKVISKWIAELRALSDTATTKFGLPADTIKAVVLPFSGGSFDRSPPIVQKAAELPFLKPGPVDGNLLGWVNKLQKENDDDFVTSAKPQGNPVAMGTSAPVPALTNISSMISQELKALSDQALLDQTIVRVIFMTDGAFTPLIDYYNKGLTLMNCPLTCPLGSTDPACDPTPQPNQVGMSAYQLCKVKYPNEFRKAFGDPNLNTYDNIVGQLKGIQALKTTYPKANIDLKLVQIGGPPVDPAADPVNIANPPAKNIFDQIQGDLGVSKYVLTSDQPPFGMSIQGQILTYQIANFYAINLNAFVNSEGKLVVDSDGDGLSDDVETQLHFDNTNPRTPAPGGNGTCLDSITYNFGCRTTRCSVTLDEDGDGLNECEEKTIGTISNRPDSDLDGILDGHEVIRDLNPNVNESKISREFDAWTDHFRFFAGLSPYVPIALVKPKDMIKYSVKFLRFSPLVSSLGPTGNSAGEYKISIDQMPLVPTLKTANFIPPNRNRGTPIPPESVNLTVGPMPHDAGENEIVLLIKVQARENSNVMYWLVKRFVINYYNPDVSVLQDINLSDFVRLDFADDGRGS